MHNRKLEDIIEIERGRSVGLQEQMRENEWQADEMGKALSSRKEEQVR